MSQRRSAAASSIARSVRPSVDGSAAASIARSLGAWIDEQRFQQRLVRAREERARDHTTAVDASARAAQAAQQARQAVVEAKREVEVLVKHGARVDARDQLQRRRRAEREADDLASARHGRK